MYFAKLDDSPMFRQQLQCLEESSESLRGRCCKFYKGCRKYTFQECLRNCDLEGSGRVGCTVHPKTGQLELVGGGIPSEHEVRDIWSKTVNDAFGEGLGEGYDGDIAFASSLEAFGGGNNDPHFVSLGGSVMSKFAIALREIGTHKELLRGQIEHMLNDRLLHFANVEIQDVKEARKRFEKSSQAYDHVRDKFLSLRKNTKMDVAAAVEEELYNARSSFEESRFNLVSALSNIEAKKRFEFLEAISGIMDAHLRYFQQGYEMLHQMEPFIHEVLNHAQRSRESSNNEQIFLVEQMQEYKKQIDVENKQSLSCPYGPPNGDCVQPFARKSKEVMEAVKESVTNGKVQIIRQGYLSKRSSNLRADWKRRYFVLDSLGMLYYYRKPWNISASSTQPPGQKSSSTENASGLLSRLLSSHYHGGVHEENSVARNTLNLLTSTIKPDSEQSDLRFCFRIISPSKVYTLQAENSVDQKDWIEKITGVITSLLSCQTAERPLQTNLERGGFSSPEDLSESSTRTYQTTKDETAYKNSTSSAQSSDSRSMQCAKYSTTNEKPIDVLRKVCGNDKCADCGAPEPDWASLNLGILVCIECSGIHRNLGVHISKIRSLTLDVKAWDPYVLNMFQSLGNSVANSIWEEQLQSNTKFQSNHIPNGPSKSDANKPGLTRKPDHNDPISAKEKFIHAKYSEKSFVCQTEEQRDLLPLAHKVWESVRANNKKSVYRHIVCTGVDINAISGKTSCNDSTRVLSSNNLNSSSEDQQAEEIADHCTVLHLACLTADIGVVELLLQYGANINAFDSKGRTPLHNCIINGKNATAKMLLLRGANGHATDNDGNTPLKLMSETGLVDNEILSLLKEGGR